MFEASRVISDKQLQYIRSKNYNINWKNGAFSRMYLNPKLHKTPLKTRAIISYCGSFCEPIAKFCNIQLQKLITHFPTFICNNSYNLLETIKYDNWTGFQMTTADASSMYTNIHWIHAKEEILKFYKSDLGKDHLKATNVNINVLVEYFQFWRLFLHPKYWNSYGSTMCSALCKLIFCSTRNCYHQQIQTIHWIL